MSVLDVVLSLIVVALAVAWLVSRFVLPTRKRQYSAPGDVVVGDALARGLTKAKARREGRDN